MKRAGLLRADALAIPLADDSVDLIITSPPYFALRSYTDDGHHYDGQIGSEPTPQAFLAALWAVTAECRRVLRPTGSMFVNLGDKYAGSGGHNNGAVSRWATAPPNGGKGVGEHERLAKRDIDENEAREWRASRRQAPDRYNQNSGGVPAKSLMGLPWRYAIGAIDQLDLILRAEIVWSKPNGLPESVTDRVRRSHEQWFHFTKEPRYFAAVDEVREPHVTPRLESVAEGHDVNHNRNDGGRALNDKPRSPLGKLPGSVWTIPSEPLQVPDWLGVDHFAAYPQEWPRRFVLGWSPSGICVECGEGRRPTVAKEANGKRADRSNSWIAGSADMRGSLDMNTQRDINVSTTITGYACACDTPTAPTRPAVVLDPFSGTGTTVGVARALGRLGVGVDLSADYIRLAQWRIEWSGHFAKTNARTDRERQGALFEAVT